MNKKGKGRKQICEAVKKTMHEHINIHNLQIHEVVGLRNNKVWEISLAVHKCVYKIKLK